MADEGAVAIIPARGGSKRLPRKNILPIGGQPMIYWTIMSAKESQLFESIIVSTEDDEIADIASSTGVSVVKRRNALATDTASVVDVCLDCLETEEVYGRAYDSFCCLYATSPFRTASDIRGTMGLLDGERCRFAIAVAEFGMYPYQAMQFEGGDNQLRPFWPNLIKVRAEDVGVFYGDAGSTYAADVESFRKEKSFFGQSLCGYVIPKVRVSDIDTADDYLFAQSLASYLELGSSS